MEIKSNEVFWSANVDEIKSGYIESSEAFKCIICEETFRKGQIYRIGSELFDSKRATELHIESNHESMLQYLLRMNPVFTGISEVQRELILLLTQGLSDKEVADKLGVAQSTIRNHRYKLREKEKQARVFLAMMELLSNNTHKKISKLENTVITDAHKTATIVDDRYNITDKEINETIAIYMNGNGALKNYPAKAKKKIIVLREIAKNFVRGKAYTEKEVNKILERIYEDHVTIRRALIEYGFIERANDCSRYWLKE
ncbi:DUF2087 domain-containing protein [Clostridium cellulovorans]|uniref:Transcriptional regulator, LuxR family n=1 Tax=Clostridium cellulovorans (strain ATCC 35296 / DSM 3052 / OCM 3 / 743B) TaxID=573061 RepID=D9SMG2_CLOC7|nr:DUF2087 domain-containing protein [Clostridium cellulovorans]ADL53818.1 transcriptional regulator, LuxR family [Clostridium cellulovorans 743B]